MADTEPADATQGGGGETIDTFQQMITTVMDVEDKEVDAGFARKVSCCA